MFALRIMKRDKKKPFESRNYKQQLNLEFEAQNEINNDFERRKIVMTYLIHCWVKQLHSWWNQFCYGLKSGEEKKN